MLFHRSKWRRRLFQAQAMRRRKPIQSPQLRRFVMRLLSSAPWARSSRAWAAGLFAEGQPDGERADDGAGDGKPMMRVSAVA